MKKNQKTLEDRAEYVKNQVNERHKSLNVADVIRRTAQELFLSEDTIWKDFAKNKHNEKNN
jgi:hypothetical protein